MKLLNTAGRKWFLPWKTIEGEEVAPASVVQLEVLLRGMFEKRRFLDLLRYFIVFEQERGAPTHKKIAGYHQFHAVNVAVEETIRAAKEEREIRELKGRYTAGRMKDGAAGDRRIGVVWHTQGAGKSLTMAFYTGRIVLHPAMENPTIVVITDRNDLDGQLFGTFSRCAEVLRQVPEQAAIAYDSMINTLKSLYAKKSELTVAEFRDLLNTSRKFALPFLEHLDAAKVTLRVGDSRKLLLKG